MIAAERVRQVGGFVRKHAQQATVGGWIPLVRLRARRATRCVSEVRGGAEFGELRLRSAQLHSIGNAVLSPPNVLLFDS